jgi:hypothetical protein
MSRITLHLLQSADCSATTYDELVRFIQPEMQSELFELQCVKPDTKTILSVSEVPSFQELFAVTDAYRMEHGIREKDFVFLVTEKLTDQRYFCALADGNSTSGFIHANSWKYTMPDLPSKAESSANAYLVYSLILRRFQYTALQHPNYTDVFRNATFVHRDTRSCFNNWVANKRFIENLLNSVFVCSSCQNSILAGGLSAQHFKVIKQVFEKIRSNVLAMDEDNPFENGQLYVFQNHVELVYHSNDNYGKVAFSQKVGEMSYFVFYVYLLLMNRKVDLIEWNDNPEHFQLMRRIVRVAQGAVLNQPLNETAEERFKELVVLKKYGTLNPHRTFEFQDTNIGTFVNRVNAKFIQVYTKMGIDNAMAENLASEYFVKGTRDLDLKLDRNRVFFDDRWLDEFQDDFPHMQRMPE